jgi:hypothetical protein
MSSSSLGQANDGQTSSSSIFVEGELGSSSKEMDILHPCQDYCFKKVMNDPIVLSSFLNTILELEDKVESIQYLKTELPSAEIIGKDFIVDILCETEDGKRFIIEMQNDYRGDYANKAIVEFCRLIAYWDQETIHNPNTSEQAKKKSRANTAFEPVKRYWRDITTAITIVITNKTKQILETID